MLFPETKLTATTVDDSAPQPPSAEASQVLITTQQVAFGTAAGRGVRRKKSAGLVAVVRRLFAAPADAAGPRRKDYPRRYAFLEQALLAREMERL